MKAIVVHEYGGPEVLKFEEYPVPGPREVLVRVAAAEALANWVALHKLRSQETDSISERRTK